MRNDVCQFTVVPPPMHAPARMPTPTSRVDVSPLFEKQTLCRFELALVEVGCLIRRTGLEHDDSKARLASIPAATPPPAPDPMMQTSASSFVSEPIDVISRRRQSASAFGDGRYRIDGQMRFCPASSVMA